MHVLPLCPARPPRYVFVFHAYLSFHRTRAARSYYRHQATEPPKWTSSQLRPGASRGPPLYHRRGELTPLRSFTSCNELPREDFPARRGCAQAPSCRATLSHLHSARRVARKLDKSRRGCSLRRYGMCGPERPRRACGREGGMPYQRGNVAAPGLRRASEALAERVVRHRPGSWILSLVQRTSLG